MARKAPAVYLKRAFTKRRSSDVPGTKDEGYTLLQVLRAFVGGCAVKGSIQAPKLLELIEIDEEHNANPLLFGMEVNTFIFRRLVGSYFDARAEAADRADLSGAQGHPGQQFQPELELRFGANLILIGRPRETGIKISLAEHDQHFTLWIEGEEHRPLVGNMYKRALALMEAIGETADDDVWFIQGLNYDLDPHERRSLRDFRGTGRYYRLMD